MLFFENYQDYGMRDTFIPKPKQKSIPWNTSPQTRLIHAEGEGLPQEGQTPLFRNQQHKDAYMTMLNSLKLAIEQAGGSPRHFVNNLGTMSVHELLATLCTNSVLFVYEPYKY